MTLKSILNQTFPANEILVVDDGSIDHTETVVGEFCRRGVTYLKIENSGPLRARNVGLTATTCERVAFCDSDDLWEPGFLEAAAQLWARGPAMVASYTNFRTLSARGMGPDSKFDRAPPHFWAALKQIAPGLAYLDQSFSAQLIEFQPFFPTGMIVNRDAFLRLGGWDEGVSRIVGSDFATVLRLSERPPIGLLQEPLAIIRKHESNISGNTESMNLGNADILEYVLATRPTMTQIKDKILSSIAARRRDALDSAFVRHDLEAVRAIYRMLPATEQPSIVKLKAKVAALPAPLASVANEVALWLGSSKAAFASLLF